VIHIHRGKWTVRVQGEEGTGLRVDLTEVIGKTVRKAIASRTVDLDEGVEGETEMKDGAVPEEGAAGGHLAAGGQIEGKTVKVQTKETIQQYMWNLQL
jgi:hypothetical protein